MRTAMKHCVITVLPFPGREDEIELIELELQRLISGREEECRDHYIISGASGIGKTRLMDHFYRLAGQKNIRFTNSLVQTERRIIYCKGKSNSR
jgi:predicted ATPase